MTACPCFIELYGDLNCLNCEGNVKNTRATRNGLPRSTTKSKVKLVATEHQEQVALFQCFRMNEHLYPELRAAFAVPNGQLRDRIIAAKLKAEGVKAGVPDIFIPAPRGRFHGLFVELKSQKGRLRERQEHMMSSLGQLGYACIWARGWELAWGEIKKYLDSGKTVPSVKALSEF